MKKLVFSLIMVSMVYLFVEVFSYTAYRVKFGEYRLQNIQSGKIQAAEILRKSKVFEPEQAIDATVEVKPILHPYLGYSVDGKRRSADCNSPNQHDCLRRIKVPTDSRLATRADSRLVVGVVGGSFADGSVRGGSPDIYAKLLAKLPQYRGRDVIVYNMAAGGYKQPQQLMQVAYYYALGAEFDIIINIDGFNEMAATFYGWRDSELHPAFPVSWNHRVASGIAEGQLDLLADKRQLQKSHAARARFWLSAGVRYSPTMNLAWKIMENSFHRQQAELDRAIAEYSSNQGTHRDFSYEALGPDYDIESMDQLFDYATELWADSSRALHALATGHNADYYHFIQPNQYIDGAKILSEFEQQSAVLPSGGYGNVYKQAYPKLARKARQLDGEGINLVNLTYLFADNADDLYIDNCCHLNPKGYDLVARAVVREIAALQQRGSGGPGAQLAVVSATK